jgi:hypothetical protein
MDTLYLRMSALKKFMRCRRSFWLSYGHNMELPPDPEKPQSGARDIGTLFHLCAEWYYRGLDWRALLTEQRMDAAAEGKDWDDVYLTVGRMFETFPEWLAETGADAGEHTLILPDGEPAIERRFFASAGHYHGVEVIIHGEPDRLVVDEATGLIICDDIKTVQGLGRPPMLGVDFQNQTYGWLLESNGIRAQRFRHTQAKKNKRTAQARPPFFERHSVGYTEAQKATYLQHLGGLLTDIVGAMLIADSAPDAHHGTLYPNPTNDCDWDCDFVGVCHMMDQGDDWRGYLADNYQERESLVTIGGSTE